MHVNLTPKNLKMWSRGFHFTPNLYWCLATQNWTRWSIGQIVSFTNHFSSKFFSQTSIQFPAPWFLYQGSIHPLNGTIFIRSMWYGIFPCNTLKFSKKLEISWTMLNTIVASQSIFFRTTLPCNQSNKCLRGSLFFLMK